MSFVNLVSCERGVIVFFFIFSFFFTPCFCYVGVHSLVPLLIQSVETEVVTPCSLRIKLMVKVLGFGHYNNIAWSKVV